MSYKAWRLRRKIMKRFAEARLPDGSYNIVQGPDGNMYLNPSDFTRQQWDNGYTRKIDAGNGIHVWADENGYSPSFGISKEDWYQNMGIPLPK